MKLIASVLLIMLLSFVLCLYMDWWSIAIAAFLVSILIQQPPLHAFLTGFIALVLLWGGLSWWIDMRNHHVLAHRLAPVLHLGASSFLMILVTALIGGIVGGLASLTASYARAKPRMRPDEQA